MSDERSMRYAETLSKMIQCETVTVGDDPDKSKFLRFHELLKELFPNLFGVGTFEVFDGSFLLRWPGKDETKEPMLLMHHHDVVEAPGEWKYPPFSGTIAEDRVWGRGTLDTKGGLWGMLQAADELAKEGFIPERDIYFESACTEESTGTGAQLIAAELEKRGIHFFMSLDEGGMILYDPIGGADGTFAMVGLGEKGIANIKFIAKSNGGHASTPGKNTPLVRLGKFMAAVEKSNIFTAEVSPVICEMFARLSSSMNGPLKTVFANASKMKPVLAKVMPNVSPMAGAMLKTTIAFTMAHGSDASNVLPREAYVIANMRFSHHQGGDASIEAVRELAKKFDIETEVLDKGPDSPLASCDSEGFRLVEDAVTASWPGVKTAPYIMNQASDSRYMSKVTDCALRFAPFKIDKEQMASIHGANENVDIASLAPAVDFFRHLMQAV